MAASEANDIEVVVERTEGYLGAYMGIYEAGTSYGIGLHYQYYTVSSLLKTITYYEWDEPCGQAYYYNNDSKLIYLSWANTEGEIVKMIMNGVNGAEWK